MKFSQRGWLLFFNKFRLLLIGILLIGISLEIRNLKLGIGVVNAQVPPPTTTCSTADPEFHSLRPYQASPCQSTVSPTATFCGDSLTFNDTINMTYTPATDNCTAPDSNGKVTCTYSVPQTISNIKIDLKDATLPIMGNTENVQNSTTPTGTPPPLSDTDKVNGYISWYLNGVMNRAEDGSSKTTDKITTDYNIVNLSGPLNKLLPSVILDAQRIKTINNAEVTNHNQIAVCYKKAIPFLPYWLTNLLGIGAQGLGKVTPVECYKGDGSTAMNGFLGIDSGSVLRLTGWKSTGLEIALQEIEQWVYDKHLYPNDWFSELIANATLDRWDKKTPPLPWADQNNVPFETAEAYQKAYNEWRGSLCAYINLPILGNKLVCVNIPGVTNSDYADLYPYIPLSSTEDVTGSAKIATTVSSTAGVTISDVNTTGLESPTLYFAHMQESSSLATQLQNTYLYKGANGSATGESVPPQVGDSCKVVDVRSNKGDNLFATPITGNVSYTATFTCDFSVPRTSIIGTPPNTDTCDNCTLGIKKSCTGATGEVGTQTCVISENCAGRIKVGNWGGCIKTITPPAVQTCTKTIPVTLAITTITPLVDDVWAKLVSGTSSVFRRMFPKLGAGSQLGQVKDIPASTAVKYSGTVNGEAVPESTGQLNFPHIGGISEYFLKGIQTMLRPKGYGEPISFGETTTSLPPLGEIDCDQSAPDPNLPDTIGREALHALAMNWIGGQEGDRVLECYNDVARKSLAAGISPAFTFFMWLHESGGSNYNISNQDFGINSADVIGFTAQITRFLGLPKGYMNTYPQCFGVGNDTLSYFDLFAVGLQGGLCVHGSENGQNYIDMITTGWNWFTSCPMANYPFGSSCY